jgi:hypothetical protein
LTDLAGCGSRRVRQALRCSDLLLHDIDSVGVDAVSMSTAHRDAMAVNVLRSAASLTPC